MPLHSIPKDATKKERNKIVSKNIEIEVAAGRPRKQAIAIALRKERDDMNKHRRGEKQ